MAILSLEVSPFLTYIYDLGTAHGRQVSQTLEEFGQAIHNAVIQYEGRPICCWTNNQQALERKYLENVGFSASAIGTGDRMQFHAISWEDWLKFYSNIEEIVKEAKRKEEALINAFFDELRESEKEQGRKANEIRVGDVICYVSSKPKRDDYLIYSKNINKNLPIYKVTSIKVDGSIGFKGWHYDKFLTIEEYKNYDNAYFGYPADKCVRLYSDWGKGK